MLRLWNSVTLELAVERIGQRLGRATAEELERLVDGLGESVGT